MALPSRRVASSLFPTMEHASRRVAGALPGHGAGGSANASADDQSSATPKRARSRSGSAGRAEKQSCSRTPPLERGAAMTDVAAFIFRRDLRLEDNRGLLRLRKKLEEMSRCGPLLPILPLFFFNPPQADPKRNAYFGYPAFQFMCESLIHLNGSGGAGRNGLGGRLVCLYGSDESCLQQIEDAGYRIRVIGYNADYTPFARERDARLRQWCEQRHTYAAPSDATAGVPLPTARVPIEVVEEQNEYSLLPLDLVRTGAGTPYGVFTPFYKRMQEPSYWSQIPKPDQTVVDVPSWFVTDGPAVLGTQLCVDLPGLLTRVQAAVAQETQALMSSVPPPSTKKASSLSAPYEASDHGGREEALKRLQFVSSAKNYESERNFVAEERSSHLSPHLKFGTVSVREVMHAAIMHLGPSHGFPRQLVWREFYAMLLYHNPRFTQAQLRSFTGPLLAFTTTQEAAKEAGVEVPPHRLIYTRRDGDVTQLENLPFQMQYDNFPWKWSDEHFQRFQTGTTGVPLVDASVRCLNATGWCNNRSRLVIASFLVKVLFVDWREGEKWFAQRGIDFDVANNSGGWLWSSGQGADAQPYFRTFNPFLQSKRFDTDAVFIKRWVPELRDIPTRDIHNWNEYCEKKGARATSPVGCKPKADKAGSSEGKGASEGPTQRTLTGAVAAGAYPSPVVNCRQRTQDVIAIFTRFRQE